MSPVSPVWLGLAPPRVEVFSCLAVSGKAVWCALVLLSYVVKNDLRLVGGPLSLAVGWFYGISFHMLFCGLFGGKEMIVFRGSSMRVEDVHFVCSQKAKWASSGEEFDSLRVDGITHNWEASLHSVSKRKHSQVFVHSLC